MCTCASCEYTDGFLDAGFAAWPRGNPAGPRKSAASYAGHVAHSWAGVYRSVQFKPGQPPKYDIPGLVMPVTPAPKYVLDWINRNGPQFERVGISTHKRVPYLMALARELRKAA